ncbi:hypothetical protein [Bacillus nitratireducens]|uniref:hypothetical protein n=1 Tax=Bacillus nitratireducens TaxID=2026193 RepID=UPI0011A17057|nr:hypothetical protein [Bacillus nitratireducens]
MNIIDNRKKVEGTLEIGAVVVAEHGTKYLVVRDVMNEQLRLVVIDTMETAFHFRRHEFTIERVNKSITIKEIIPASEVSLVIGGTK